MNEPDCDETLRSASECLVDECYCRRRRASLVSFRNIVTNVNDAHFTYRIALEGVSQILCALVNNIIRSKIDGGQRLQRHHSHLIKNVPCFTLLVRNRSIRNRTPSAVMSLPRRSSVDSV